MPNFEQNTSNKKWSVRFRTIINGETKQKRLSGFKTKKEAQTAYIDFVKEQEQKEKERESLEKEQVQDIYFSALLNGFLQHQKTRVKESSYLTVVSKIENHIRPYFEHMTIKEITPMVVLEWQQSINDYSYRHKSSLRTLLTSIYRYGERYFGITNVMNRVEPFRNLEAKKEIQCWSLEEFNQFTEACDDELFKVMFKFMYITGCRRGEVLALIWDDINFEKRTVKISKNVTRKTSEGPYKIVTPKNLSSNRVIDLPQSICEELIRLKDKLNNKYIFGDEHPMHDNRLVRAFRSYIERAGVKKIRLHDLRHSCASLLISQGISVVAVSHRLGHKNIEQTLNTYSHLMPSEAERIINIFEKV